MTAIDCAIPTKTTAALAASILSAAATAANTTVPGAERDATTSKQTISGTPYAWLGLRNTDHQTEQSREDAEYINRCNGINELVRSIINEHNNDISDHKTNYRNTQRKKNRKSNAAPKPSTAEITLQRVEVQFASRSLFPDRFKEYIRSGMPYEAALTRARSECPSIDVYQAEKVQRKPVPLYMILLQKLYDIPYAEVMYISCSISIWLSRLPISRAMFSINNRIPFTEGVKIITPDIGCVIELHPVSIHQYPAANMWRDKFKCMIRIINYKTNGVFDIVCNWKIRRHVVKLVNKCLPVLNVAPNVDFAAQPADFTTQPADPVDNMSGSESEEAASDAGSSKSD